MSLTLEVIESLGEGPVHLFLVDETYSPLAREVAQLLSGQYKSYVVSVPVVTATDGSKLLDSLIEILQEKRIRQATLVGFGLAGSLVQVLCLQQLKLSRRIALVDGCTSPSPTRFTRFIDWLEESLPLGLPLRSWSNAFDSRSFLQRMRCPVLIVLTPRATNYHKDQAELLTKALPTAWSMQLQDSEQVATELSQLLSDFNQVSAKCPQKNLAAQAPI